MKRRIADAVLWIIGPLMDWCFYNCTWIPAEDVFKNIEDEQI